MITYHSIGYHGLFAALGALTLLRLLPTGSRAHRLLSRALLAALIVTAAIVGLSY
ncbi:MULTISPECIES: hypothetical protein [Streptomyces]|uniref:hypothetical protein n=1 Tax=Streptomyces TaxID=1883 RepID=UPI00206BB47E|nr:MULTISPECIES: hypothetical protein [Streptomyces]UPT41792.1 hypothetical protein MWG59_10330 [Streptomyces sp. WAC00303]WIY76025.1 hypothetical protein QPM16_10190 [Streptomyces anulatus]